MNREKPNAPLERWKLSVHRACLRLISPLQDLDGLLRRAVAPDSNVNISLHLLRRELGDELYLNIPARALKGNVRRKDKPIAPRDHVLGYFLLDEDWRKYLVDIKKSSIYQESVALAANPEAIKDSPWYRKTVEAMKAGKPIRRHRELITSLDALDEYLDLCKKLLSSVRENGLMRLTELDKRERRAYRGTIRPRRWESLELDLGIAVDEAGNVYRTADGQHRGALAVILDLASIPVELRLTRRDWLRAALKKRPDLRPREALRLAIRDLESDLQKNFGNPPA